jgi:3',5'-nucleoside bisphosphate phosphatase
MTADLHIHTTKSFDVESRQGGMTPLQLIDRIAEKTNTRVISFTDHDYFSPRYASYVRYAEKKGIELILGVEIDTRIRVNRDYIVHMLAYFYPGDKEIIPKQVKYEVKKLFQERRDVCDQIARRLVQDGYFIKNKIDKRQSNPNNMIVSKAEIAQRLTDKRYIILDKKLDTVQEGWDLMRKNYPDLRRATIHPAELCEIVRENGGMTSIAHPYRIKRGTQPEKTITIKEMDALIDKIQPDAIEYKYPYFDPFDKNTGERIRPNIKKNKKRSKTIERLAERKDLFLTGGTDFHGDYSDHGFVPPGKYSVLNDTKTKEFLEELKERSQQFNSKE